MSAALIAWCAAFGASAGALTPRLAYRISVPRGEPPVAACVTCATPVRGALWGWLAPGDRCPVCRARLGPPTWVTVPLGALACGVPAWALGMAGAVGTAGRAGPAGVAGGPGVAGGAGMGDAAGMADGARGAVAGALVLVAFLLVGSAGVLLGAVDMACLRLPDAVVGPLFGAVVLLLGAAAVVAGTAAAATHLFRALAAAVLMAGGYLVLALLPGGRLGMGDVKLTGVLGLLLGWLGWSTVALGAVLPHLINGPVALVLLLARRAGRGTELPLGPALLAGALAAVAAHAALPR